MKKRTGTALITGATQGIGRELAWCFARGGFDVGRVARDREKLKKVAATFQQKFDVHHDSG